jgi:FAD:protein FMN transferase
VERFVKRRLFVSATLLAATAGGLQLAGRSLRGASDAEALADGRCLVRGAALAFDTTVSICALHPDPDRARRALSRALATVTELDACLTVQRPGSLVSRLNHDGWLERPHPRLVQLLEFARTMADRSGGAFDPTVQPLWDLNIRCQRRGCRPTVDELAQARRRVNWRSIDLGPRRIELPPGMAITLNGLTQGLAADLAFDALAQDGVQDALIDAGEYGARGHAPSSGPWRVGIQHPRDPTALIGVVPMDGRFLATSGDYATRFTDDFSSHHIFDPSTGRSPGRLSSVAVAAATGLLADALTKPMMVMNLADAQRLLQRFEGAGAVWIDKSSRIVPTHNLAVEPPAPAPGRSA